MNPSQFKHRQSAETRLDDDGNSQNSTFWKGRQRYHPITRASTYTETHDMSIDLLYLTDAVVHIDLPIQLVDGTEDGV